MTNPKCLGSSLPDTFSARSADWTGLKMRRITRAVSLDHLVGAAEQRERNGEPERPGSLEIDDQLDLRCLLHRQVGRLLALKDAAGIDADQSERVRKISSVA